MIAEVQRHIRRHALLKEGQEVVVAVSGGVDSMVMLHVLHRMGYACRVAHVEHGLRGRESEEDMRFVMQQAEALGLPCHVHRADVKTHAAETASSVQMAARALRYAWLQELAAERNYTTIATAHHRDDALETLFLHMLRGTGALGWRGIPSRSGAIVRPMLAVGRAQIEAWALAEGIPWREDASNLAHDYLRNRVRHELMPLLEDLRPGAPTAIMRSMGLLEAITEAARRHTDAQLGPDPERIPFALLDGTLGILVLQRRLGTVGFHPDVLNDVLTAVQERHVGAHFTMHDVRLTVDRDALLITSAAETRQPSWHIGPDLTMPLEGPIALELAPAPDPVPAPGPHEAWLDPGALRLPWTLRPWCPGDRLVPHGMEGSRLVSDILVDAKVPLPMKAQVMVLCDDLGPIWVPGHRWATVPLARPGMKQALHVTHRR